MTEKFRSAKTGHYVTEKFANRNPATTVKETEKRSPPPPKKTK